MVRALNMITQILLVLAGLNWGTVALFDTNLVSWMFGEMAVPLYVLMGASALWQLGPLVRPSAIESKADRVPLTDGRSESRS